MSLEKILIIKQYQETDIARCKTGLEASPEKYSVVIANNYQEGFHLLKERSSTPVERMSAVIIDADEVDSYALDLLASIKGLNDFVPIIVLTRMAHNQERHALTSMASECIVKTGEYYKFLWRAVKSSLERNSNRHQFTPTKPRRVFKAFPLSKKKA